MLGWGRARGFPIIVLNMVTLISAMDGWNGENYISNIKLH